MGEVFLLAIIFLLTFSDSAVGDVLVIKDNSSFTFASTEADFTPRIHGVGVRGILYRGNPYDACRPLAVQNLTSSAFLLTMRSDCSFNTKVRFAQAAGYSAVIVFNNEYNGDLITMAGNPDGIEICAVFVSRQAGETLLNYVEDADVDVWILASDKDKLWSILVFLIIATIAGSVALAMWFFLRRQRSRQHGGQYFGSHVRCVISPQVVEGMTSISYKHNGNLKASQEVCTICLEDYITAEKLRVLPCRHRFHATCIDAWLTMWQAFCPICKRDARLETSECSVSETTPLLRPGFQSAHDVIQYSPESSPIQIPMSAPSDFLCRGSGDASCSSSHRVGSTSTSTFISRGRNSSRFSTVQASLEAFRASPYFTPPSSCQNHSPLLPQTYADASLLDESSLGSSFSFSGCSQSKSYLNTGKK